MYLDLGLLYYPFVNSLFTCIAPSSSQISAEVVSPEEISSVPSQKNDHLLNPSLIFNYRATAKLLS